MPAAAPLTPEPRRFSIRLPRPMWIGVGMGMLVVAGGLLVASQLYLQSAAIREIQRAGGSIETRQRGPDWLRMRVGDERMSLVDEVIRVKLSYSSARDETLDHLHWLSSLQRLDFNGTRVTDAGLAHLRGLTRLEWLWLADTHVTDSGLSHLKELSGLHELGLGGTELTDAGLVHLKRMSGLRELWLNGTQVSDGGLVHLKGLTRLEWLFLRNTQVTDAGIAELQRELPELKIKK